MVRGCGRIHRRPRSARWGLTIWTPRSWRSALDLFAQLGGAREARQDAQVGEGEGAAGVASVMKAGSV